DGTVTVEAHADNDANASALGGSVGALAVGAMVSNVALGTAADEEVVADVGTITQQDVVARIGEDVVIRTGTLEVLAQNEQSVDARGDALAFGLAAGTGVDVDNVIL